jgi:uncharacterized membrane protein YoaK (UPF0700 family)
MDRTPAAAPPKMHRTPSYSRLPAVKVSPIVHIGTATLAFYAGFINAVGLALAGKTIGNITGLTTKIAVDLAESTVEYLFVVQLSCFAMGSVLSGVLISSRRVGIGTELYGIVLMLVSSLIFGSWFEADKNIDAMVCFLASAMGLQNGMLTKHA